MKSKQYNVIHHDRLTNKSLNDKPGFLVSNSDTKLKMLKVWDIIWKEQVIATNKDEAIEKAIQKRGWT